LKAQIQAKGRKTRSKLDYVHIYRKSAIRSGDRRKSTRFTVNLYPSL